MSEQDLAKENRNFVTKPIVLVGLMGAGKSTIGRRLASSLGITFVDSDNEIADAAECSISDIFAVYGESTFRDLEKRVMLRLLTGGPAVVATGGGAFVNPEIRAAVKEHAVSIWLRAGVDTLLERVSRRNTRPLLETGDKREILTKLAGERESIYAEADLAVDNNVGDHEKVVASIVDILKNRQDI